MRGGREAVQALISRDVSVMQQGSSGVITAWAQGAKDLVAIGATGNKLDYIFVSTPAIKKAGRLERQTNRHKPARRQHRLHRPHRATPIGTFRQRRDARRSRRPRRALGGALRRPCRRVIVSTTGHLARAQSWACRSGSILPKPTLNTSSPDRSPRVRLSRTIAKR